MHGQGWRQQAGAALLRCLVPHRVLGEPEFALSSMPWLHAIQNGGTAWGARSDVISQGSTAAPHSGMVSARCSQSVPLHCPEQEADPVPTAATPQTRRHLPDAGHGGVELAAGRVPGDALPPAVVGRSGCSGLEEAPACSGPQQRLGEWTTNPDAAHCRVLYTGPAQPAAAGRPHLLNSTVAPR